MTQYLVRVELFGAEGRHYNDLHEAMLRLGLARYLKYPDGSARAMPTGTYIGDSALGAEALREKVCGVSNPLSPHKYAAVFACVIEPHNWAAYLYDS